MRRVIWLAILASCGNPHLARDAALAGDAAPADARPAGVIDGVCQGQPGRPRVLVYTYENQWRHLSNYYARAALLDMCRSWGFHVETTNDPHAFTATRLAGFDVVVFAVTSGSGMDRLGQQDYEAWVRAGGGTVGFEAAAATEQQWPFYVANLGASFLEHPPVNVRGTVDLVPGDPITDGLPALELVDQWYVFRSRPEQVPGLHVVMTLDESTLPTDFPAQFKIGYHALGWTYEPFGGRVFYTALGDNPTEFSNPTFVTLIGRAIEWAAHQR